MLSLIDIALFRSRAAVNGIYEINQQGNFLNIHITEIKEEQMARLFEGLGSQIVLKAAEKPYYCVRLEKGQTATDCLKKIAALL